MLNNNNNYDLGDIAPVSINIYRNNWFTNYEGPNQAQQSVVI